jgi:ubiquinone/menaquinone biosynthesis C-methylase UbiE
MKPAPSAESTQNYIKNYDRHNGRQETLAGRMMNKSHAILESTFDARRAPRKILEVGAGTGSHVQYVEMSYDAYHLTDASDEMLALANQKLATFAPGRLVFEKQDAAALSYADASFDRLIATHVLEHIPDPVAVLAEWDRVVRPGGAISILLPCDPGVLWRFGRYLGPRSTALKAGVEYDYLVSAEHVNSIFNLVTFIRYHFDDVHERWHPAGVPVPDLNLFYLCHIYK